MDEEKIQFGYMKIADALPLFVAIEKGYFKENFLKIELVEFTTGNAIISAMKRGIIIGGACIGFAPIFFANKKNTSFTMIADGGKIEASPRPYFGIVTIKHSGIRKIEDLNRKKIAINGYNTNSDVFFQVASKKAGIESNIVTLPFPYILNALRDGHIDAGIISEPYMTIASESIGINVIPDFEEYIRSLQRTAVCISNDYISKNPYAVKKFVLAYNKAIEFINNNSEQARELFSKWMNLPIAVARKMTMLKWDVDFNNTEIIDKYNKVLAEFNIKERGNIFVKELEVTFGNRKKVTAIKDLNFEAKAGELICLLGTTGCGKSTILNAIAGFVSPTNGQIFLDEKPICEAGLERGIVFQRPALFPWRTVKRNVEFGLEMKGISKADRSKIAAAYINIVGLDGFEKNYPSELSGGMEQRVDIARVLANDPLVILMDEPFGSLDAQTRSIMQELLLNISEEFGKTIIFVTHDVDEAIFLADRIVVLTALPGKVKEEIRVSLPRPRSYEVVISNEYINIKKRVLGLIREETLKIVKSIPNISAIDLN